MTEVEIMTYCYSEKEDASIGFGTSFDSEEELINNLDTDWIEEGLSDSFLENYIEFEPGIEKAKQLIKSNPNLTFRQALHNIFGNFSISYEMKGKEIALQIEIDINQTMYDMLET